MFRIIKGTFHVTGFQPDGDSIRFKAEKPSQWAHFKWKKMPKRKNPMVQIRLEGIDAVETHYNGYSQPRSFGLGALEKMLDYLGIHWVAYSLSARTIVSAKDGVPGYIAVAMVDDFNRPVCLAFPGDVDLKDGDELSGDELPIYLSVNYRMCLEGLVYPTFYTTTDAQIVQHISEATRLARENRRGFWVIDRTDGFALWDIRTIYDDVLIMPKLFRRLTAFCERSGDIADLVDYLKRDKDPIHLKDGIETSLDQLIKVTGRYIQLLRKPEEIFFVPK